MTKEVYYNEREGRFFIRESGTNNRGQEWGPCPYDPETQMDLIEKLEQTYTNGYLATEWRNEKKAKTDFLEFADIAMTYLANSEDSYQKLAGDLPPDYQGMLFRNPTITGRYIGDLAGNFF